MTAILLLGWTATGLALHDGLLDLGSALEIGLLVAILVVLIEIRNHLASLTSNK